VEEEVGWGGRPAGGGPGPHQCFAKQQSVVTTDLVDQQAK